MTLAGDADFARRGLADGPVRRGLRVRLAETLEVERPRWFPWLAVLLGGGIGAYFALPVEPTLPLALSPLAAALALRATMARGTLAAAFAGALIALTLGFALAKVRTEWVRGPVLQHHVTSSLAGFVELVEPKPTRGGRVTIRIAAMDRLEPSGSPMRARIRVLSDVSHLHPGDPVRLTASLSPPPPPALPGSYDFARSAWFMGLGAVGFSARAPVVDRSIGASPRGLVLSGSIARLRLAIGRRITAALPGETGAIANALITGERGGITEATNTAFRNSGLFHALSISGLHMAVMAGAIFWSLRLALAAVPALALRFAIKKWAAAGAALGALGYLLISGASPPAERSYIMISIMFLAILLDRSALALRNIALSAILILVVFPESLFDLGFQMSYAAVGALVAAHEELQRRWPGGQGGHAQVAWLRQAGWPGRVLLLVGGISLSTVIASLAVAPFGAYYFHSSQQYAIVGNVLGLPICDLFIMPMALASLVAMPLGLEALPLWLMGLGIDAMVWCARLVAALPGAVAAMPAMPALAFELMVAGGIWLALWATSWRRLGLIAIVAGAGLAPFGPRPDIIVGPDGRMVAVRGTDGRLSALPVKGNSFELARWLETDGDARPVREAAAGAGFRCDGSGCTARVKGLTLAISQSPDAVADDCGRADIVIVAIRQAPPCAQPRLLLDAWRLRGGGVHTISIRADGIRVTNVAELRGERPWSMPERARRPRRGQVAREGAGAEFTVRPEL
jgi:competence protein ComEC